MTPNRAEMARFNRQAKPQASGCWLWTGINGTRDGYGKFQPSPGQPKQMAHRWSYEAFIGPIPEGMQIDHLCHTDDTECPGGRDCVHRRCVNPEHLEAVTASENTMRQRHYERARTECPKVPIQRRQPDQWIGWSSPLQGMRPCEETGREARLEH